VGDGETGVAIYGHYLDSKGVLQIGWTVEGGTSLGAPAWAALIALADQKRLANNPALGTLVSGTQTLPALYSLPSSDFHDVTVGYTGLDTNGNTVYGKPGYDLITGLGSPVANLVVLALAGTTLSASSLGGQAIASDTAIANGSSGAAAQGSERAAAPRVAIGASSATSDELGALDWLSSTGTTGATPGVSKPFAPGHAVGVDPVSSTITVVAPSTGVVNQPLLTAPANRTGARAASTSRRAASRLASIDHLLEHDLLASLEWAMDHQSSHAGSVSERSVRLHYSGVPAGLSSAIQYGQFSGKRVIQAHSSRAMAQNRGRLDLSSNMPSGFAVGESESRTSTGAGPAQAALIETRRSARPS
jgi:hypothetical protein